MEILRFKPDSSTRRRFFDSESFSHPAKMHCALPSEIASRYGLKPGDWVLDPMAGSGTTMLLALQGINVCLIELEEHFCKPMLQSLAKLRQNGPMLGCEMGQAVIIRGDARCLPLCSVNAVLTSPPWADEREGAGIRTPGHPDGERKGLTHWGYTRPVGVVVSSPPYEKQDTSAHPGVLTPILHTMGRANRDGTGHDLSENIGNQRGQAYWDSMRQVYAECHRVLRPNGVMALVLKGFTRDGKYVDLPSQTAELVESLGFRQFDHWKRELWSLSFWRILQKRRDPAAFDDRLNYEEVLAFRKDGDGGGIDSVISSPPYEGSEVSAGNVGNRIKAETWGTGRSLAPDRGYTRPGPSAGNVKEEA